MKIPLLASKRMVATTAPVQTYRQYVLQFSTKWYSSKNTARVIAHGTVFDIKFPNPKSRKNSCPGSPRSQLPSPGHHYYQSFHQGRVLAEANAVSGLSDRYNRDRLVSPPISGGNSVNGLLPNSSRVRLVSSPIPGGNSVSWLSDR